MMKVEWTNKDSLTSGETTKAILVIDVPMLYDGRHLCNECPIWNDEHWFCQYDFNMKAKGCTLRPLPSFKAVDLNDTRDVIMFCHGWNACINAIVGDTDDTKGENRMKDCRKCQEWETCPCGKSGHIKGTSIGYSIGECKDYKEKQND